MNKFDLIKFADDYNVSETIEFAIWLTGHDEATIKQMYNDFKQKPIRCYTNIKNNSYICNVVQL